MCKRLPVPNDDDMQWMRAGQPIISLIADAYETQKAKARAEEEEKEAAKAAKEAAEAAAAIPDSEKDAVGLMNSAMDDLEKLFGFGDAPEEPEEVEPAEPEEEEEFEPITSEDTKLDSLMYHYKDADYLVTGHRDLEIKFCPFCGSKLSETE